jgi:O-antigen/teichoic acid export membrane protein
MQVGKLTLRSFVGQLTGAVVMVTWAAIHPSIWALLAGNLAAAVATLAFSYTLIPGQRNWFRWDKSSAQELMRFGRWIFISTMLTFLALQSDRLIFGKLITLHELGIYSVAAMMAALPTTAILKLGGVVVFPAYSRARAAGANFQRVFDQVRMPLLAGAGLIAAGMVGGGRQVIELLYDPRYHDAGTMLQLLSVAGWFQVMQVTNGSALLALGSPRSVAAANVVKLLAIVVFVPLGFWRYGLHGGIIGIIVADALKYAASAFAASRKGLHMLGRDLALSLLVAVTGVAAALAAEWVRHRASGPRIGGVLALLVVGAIVGTVWGPVVVRSLRARKVVS